MNKYAIMMIAGALAPLCGQAQSAVDAMQISQSDFKGTARFMSMGGAFTALGGDLSTISQNPAGIGIYRSSEVGVTLDIDIQKSSTSPHTFGVPYTASQTKAYCNSFGYVGATNISGSALRTFNWGVSYNRAASFDRKYRGSVEGLQTSLSNYIAYFSSPVGNFGGYDVMDLESTNDYNAYFDGGADWLSILAYDSYLINPVSNSLTENKYNGLFQDNTKGKAEYNVWETGRVDEYNISFGGNVENLVYWGLAIGITDLNYTRSIYYAESLDNARIHNVTNTPPTCTGTADYQLNSRKYINGSGWNIKLGAIVKPINELRFGFAFHSPTWYKLSQGYDGSVDFKYVNPTLPDGYKDQYGNIVNPLESWAQTENAYFQWHFRTPWKLMAGVAGVIGKQAIISFDYQYDAYNKMSIATPIYYDEWGGADFETDEALVSNIKQYYKGTSTFRLGAEYRVTPQFSVRAGYNYQTSGVKAQANGNMEIVTWGTDPSYDFTKNVQNISCGVGYKYQNWYIDAAYVYRQRESTYHAFTDFGTINVAPKSKLTEHNSQIVLTTGFKF